MPCVWHIILRQHRVPGTDVYKRQSQYATISLTSSNEKVATVNSFGRVTGVSPGTATITAACGSVTASKMCIRDRYCSGRSERRSERRPAYRRLCCCHLQPGYRQRQERSAQPLSLIHISGCPAAACSATATSS